jgi:hypothetical protein
MEKKKTNQEVIELKNAKLMHKQALKRNKPAYIAERDEWVKQMINGCIPNFGSLNIKLVNW